MFQDSKSVITVNVDTFPVVSEIVVKALPDTGFKVTSSPEVIKNPSCSTQLSMKFFRFINVKMPTIVGILTFMSRKNSIIELSEPEKS